MILISQFLWNIFLIINNIYNYREYCALNNPITNLFMKSNGMVVMDLKKNKGRPDTVKLRLPLTLNEVILFEKT